VQVFSSAYVLSLLPHGASGGVRLAEFFISYLLGSPRVPYQWKP
jgi:hypothetical protein